MRLRRRGRRRRRGGGWRAGSGQSARERRIWVEKGIQKEEESKRFGKAGMEMAERGESDAY